ncbi:MAG: ribosome-binding factor A [Acidobacteriota bacterium]|nr:ribosome-binding factor A [Acidobacteriota bacterium]
MRVKMTLSIAIATGVAAFYPGIALAQDMQPCTTVASFHVRPGKEQQFLDLIKKYDEPLFDGLMKKGKVMAWGVSVPVLHEGGVPTHNVWWMSPSMAEMDAILAALETQVKEMLAEDPKIFETFAEIVDLSRHADRVYRDLIFSGGTPPAPGARPFVWIFNIKAKPGRESEFLGQWTELRKPLLDKLVAAGLVHAYGLSIQEVRFTDDFSHRVWVSVPDFASYEKARAMYVAALQKESPELRQALLDLVDPSADRSIVLRDEIFHLAPM